MLNFAGLAAQSGRHMHANKRGTNFAIPLAYFREEWVQGLRPWRRTNRRFPPVDEALTSACGGYYVKAEINRKGVISA